MMTDVMTNDRSGDLPGHTHETACLNCATPLVGSHCHECGQPAHVHRTLGAFFHDLLHGVFHFEGRIWRTLPALMLRPGRLTRDYIDGRRTRYVSPIALFLFTVFVLFSTVSLTNGAIEVQPNPKITQADLSGAPPVIDHLVRTLLANPALTVYKLQSYAYKYTWLLVPLSVPFLWLLFPFSRRFGLYDHTVFVTYSLCFMTLLVVALMMLAAIPVIGAAVPLVPIVVPPLHMFAQLRGTYDLSKTGAAWRTALLLVVSIIVLALFALFVVVQSGH